MTINYLLRPGVKIDIELSFVDAKLIKVCGHCKVNGFAVKYRMGSIELSCQMEDNGRAREALIEWYLN